MIESFRFGLLRVAGEDHRKDLLVFAPGLAGPDEVVVPGWWRERGHSLAPSDLEEVGAARPRILVIGCGAHGGMAVPEATVDWLADLEIEAIVCRTTDEAVARYNELLRAGERVAGAFHLTC